MSSSATGVQYHVSDFLKDRHPYKVSDGFKAQAERDKKTLFNGFGNESLQYNIQQLQNTEITVDNKEKTLKFILGELMSAETKVRLLKYGIVQSLNWLVEHNLNSLVDELACKAYRSLAVIPTCSLSIFRNDGLGRILEVLTNREIPITVDNMNPTERLQTLQAREAACDAIKQLCMSWNSRAIVLGEEIPPGFAGLACEAPGVKELSPDGQMERKKQARAVIQALTDILASFNKGEIVSLKLVKLSLNSLGHLSSESSGLELCLVCGVLKEIDELLRQFALQPTKWVDPDGTGGMETALGEQIVQQAVTVVWNVCMDPIGKKTIPDSMSGLPFCLGCVLLTALQHKGKYLALKAAVTGALSAIYIYEEAKSSAIEPLFSDPTEAEAMGVPQDAYTDIAELCVHLMQETLPLHGLVKAGKWQQVDEDSSEEQVRQSVEAVAKNTVQCLRLVSELPIARTRVSVLIGSDRNLCIMLFRGTPIEHEMMDACGLV
eukprot:TRINITY_DN93816_c0_g1_i1.p1 TRINITY_DN93816_c0_g1~~TRINITY_DN93816_c0_g1_i1.p1  ORF type:complete len:492 (-),score=48.01 TRINITY_DN93816_c0_g1_i1:170-1645(-)